MILKCLERQPERRYSSAEALASDLELWLTGSPVEAIAPTGWHRLRSWARRHPALVARLLGFTAFFLILVVGTVRAQDLRWPQITLRLRDLGGRNV